MDEYSQTDSLATDGFELSREARAQADIKFTYVVSCQIYGQQKQNKKPEAFDIALLLQRYQCLTVMVYSSRYPLTLLVSNRIIVPYLNFMQGLFRVPSYLQLKFS